MKKRVGDRKETKGKSCSCFECKGRLVVFIRPYFVNSNIFEAKALCDEYLILVQPDSSWLNRMFLNIAMLLISEKSIHYFLLHLGFEANPLDVEGL